MLSTLGGTVIEGDFFDLYGNLLIYGDLMAAWQR